MKQPSKILPVTLALLTAGYTLAANPQQPLLNDPVDISGDFRALENYYYLADQLSDFDPATHSGKIIYQRAQLVPKPAFDNDLAAVTPAQPNEFPENEYAANPSLPFSVEFVSPRAVRIRLTSGPQVHKNSEELMPAGEVPHDDPWKYEKISGGHRYTSAAGSVTISENPFHIELRDASGKLLTATGHTADNKSSFTPIMPFAFVRRTADYSRSFNAAFTLSPGEKIFGCGESFTGLDKRGQKIVLWTDDANGVQSREIYKPIPFFMSSRGYGMCIHTTTPITCDFGNTFNGVNSLMVGDDELDLFVFLGTPKEILDEYTQLTGRSPMPPLWSFGLWMSRCTYSAEKQVREIADKLRAEKIPCDVLHLDTGWFETDWQCDHEFSTTRFTDPKKMLADLKDEGFHVSCWQLPYFVPKNKLFPELLEKISSCATPKEICLTRTPCWIFPIRKPSSGIKASWRTCSTSVSARSRWILARPRQTTASGRTDERVFTNIIYFRSATTRPAPTSRSRRRVTTSSGRAARGRAASAIRFIGVGTPRARTTGRLRNSKGVL